MSIQRSAFWRTALAGGLLAAAAVSAPASAAIDIQIGPPAPQVEVVPAPRRGYEWAPGFWAWDGRRHVWHRGHWIAERRGYGWVPDHWVEAGGRHRFEPGHWDRR